jgi:hypothetical protein
VEGVVEADRLVRKVVQQICGNVEPFYPVTRRNRSLKSREQVMLLMVWRMRRSVWTRHPQNHPIGGEECVRGSIVELTTIVAWDDFDGVAKLCRDIREF